MSLFYIVVATIALTTEKDEERKEIKNTKNYAAFISIKRFTLTDYFSTYANKIKDMIT